MKRSIVAAMACAVWLSGAASAAALTYTLNRPLTPPAVLAESRPTGGVPGLELFASAVPDVVQRQVPEVLQIPVVTIVGRTLVRSAPPPPVAAPTVPRDITEMKCAEWRDLDIGSGRVQVCQ